MDTNVLTASLIPITTALVQLVKQLDQEEKYSRFYPLLSEVIGFGLGMAAGVPWLLSLTIGLSAMGLYGGVVKTTIKGQ